VIVLLDRMPGRPVGALLARVAFCCRWPLNDRCAAIESFFVVAHRPDRMDIGPCGDMGAARLSAAFRLESKRFFGTQDVSRSASSSA